MNIAPIKQRDLLSSMKFEAEVEEYGLSSVVELSVNEKIGEPDSQEDIDSIDDDYNSEA